MRILTTPDPVLTHPAKKVPKIDKKILGLIEEMKQTLEATENPKGVGLAAPQIGKSLRIFITKPVPSSEIQVFINPEIILRSEELTDSIPENEGKLEGGLSIPGVWGSVKRHLYIKLRFKTPDGQVHNQKFSGFMAIIIQHEMDHLEGKLFSNRVLEQKSKFFKIKKSEEGKDVLEEVGL